MSLAPKGTPTVKPKSTSSNKSKSSRHMKSKHSRSGKTTMMMQPKTLAPQIITNTKPVMPHGPVPKFKKGQPHLLMSGVGSNPPDFFQFVDKRNPPKTLQGTNARGLQNVQKGMGTMGNVHPLSHIVPGLMLKPSLPSLEQQIINKYQNDRAQLQIDITNHPHLPEAVTEMTGKTIDQILTGHPPRQVGGVIMQPQHSQTFDVPKNIPGINAPSIGTTTSGTIMGGNRPITPQGALQGGTYVYGTKSGFAINSKVPIPLGSVITKSITPNHYKTNTGVDIFTPIPFKIGDQITTGPGGETLSPPPKAGGSNTPSVSIPIHDTTQGITTGLFVPTPNNSAIHPRQTITSRFPGGVGVPVQQQKKMPVGIPFSPISPDFIPPGQGTSTTPPMPPPSRPGIPTTTPGSTIPFERGPFGVFQGPMGTTVTMTGPPMNKQQAGVVNNAGMPQGKPGILDTVIGGLQNIGSRISQGRGVFDTGLGDVFVQPALGFTPGKGTGNTAIFRGWSNAKQLAANGLLQEYIDKYRANPNAMKVTDTTVKFNTTPPSAETMRMMRDLKSLLKSTGLDNIKDPSAKIVFTPKELALIQDTARLQVGSSGGMMLKITGGKWPKMGDWSNILGEPWLMKNKEFDTVEQVTEMTADRPITKDEMQADKLLHGPLSHPISILPISKTNNLVNTTKTQIDNATGTFRGKPLPEKFNNQPLAPTTKTRIGVKPTISSITGQQTSTLLPSFKGKPLNQQIGSMVPSPITGKPVTPESAKFIQYRLNQQNVKQFMQNVLTPPPITDPFRPLGPPTRPPPDVSILGNVVKNPGLTDAANHNKNKLAAKNMAQQILNNPKMVTSLPMADLMRLRSIAEGNITSTGTQSLQSMMNQMKLEQPALNLLRNAKGQISMADKRNLVNFLSNLYPSGSIQQRRIGDFRDPYTGQPLPATVSFGPNIQTTSPRTVHPPRTNQTSLPTGVGVAPASNVPPAGGGTGVPASSQGKSFVEMIGNDIATGAGMLWGDITNLFSGKHKQTTIISPITGQPVILENALQLR